MCYVGVQHRSRAEGRGQLWAVVLVSPPSCWFLGLNSDLSGLSSKHSYPMSYLNRTDLTTVLDPFSGTFLTYLEIKGKQTTRREGKGLCLLTGSQHNAG